MRNVKVLLSMVLAVFLINLPFAGTVEAARVAVLPLQFSDAVTERVNDFTGYYWDIMVEKFQYPEYELMDDEKISEILHDEDLKLYDKPSLADVAERADADIVVVMRLDRLDEESDYFRNEPIVHFRMNGEFASFNRLTGKYYNKKFYEKYDIGDELTLKNDWQQMTFAELTKRYLYRALKAK